MVVQDRGFSGEDCPNGECPENKGIQLELDWERAATEASSNKVSIPILHSNLSKIAVYDSPTTFVEETDASKQQVTELVMIQDNSGAVHTFVLKIAGSENYKTLGRMKKNTLFELDSLFTGVFGFYTLQDSLFGMYRIDQNLLRKVYLQLDDFSPTEVDDRGCYWSITTVKTCTGGPGHYCVQQCQCEVSASCQRAQCRLDKICDADVFSDMPFEITDAISNVLVVTGGSPPPPPNPYPNGSIGNLNRLQEFITRFQNEYDVILDDEEVCKTFIYSYEAYSTCMRNVLIDNFLFANPTITLTPQERSWLVENFGVFETLKNLYIQDEGSVERVSAFKMSIIAAVQNLYEGPYNQAHFDLIKPNLPNAGAGITSPQWWEYFTVQCAIIRQEHPEYNTAQVYYEASKEMIHIALDIGGLVPVVGEVCDFANGILYTIEGDGVNASLSFAATIPVVGSWVTASKYGKKAITALNGTRRTLKWATMPSGFIVFGERTQLRKVLGLATTDTRQAHHILPWGLGGHPMIQKAASYVSNPFHLNELKNGIPLPTTAGTGLPQHLGSHGDYTARVSNALNSINTFVNSQPPAIQAQVAAQKVRELIDNINTAINSGAFATINDVIW